ncbi:MAG: adenosylcobinamide-phosphate synthase CbiB [Methylovirgula sp.]
MGFSLALAALVIEALVGYPGPLFEAIGHPVTWIARLIVFLEAHGNDAKASPARRRLAGAFALVLLLLIVGLLAEVLVASFAFAGPVLGFLLLACAASTLLAQRSLDQHVRAVAQALEQEGVPAARAAVANIVGRDTTSLDRAGVARAAIESLAESFSDGVVAPALWIALLGLPGGALYKAINTADSMIGHRTPRYQDFGFAAAKLDDFANWPAARLAALWIGLAALLLPEASIADAWRVVRRDARLHVSPNAGWPEAAFAGALSLRLGGPRAYTQKKDGGRRQDRWIGNGRAELDAPDIRRALRLYRRACLIHWAALGFFAGLIFLIAPR